MSEILETTLSEILVQLANFFGTTTNTVIEQLPTWLAKYGWYVTLNNIGFNLLIAFILVGIVMGLTVFFTEQYSKVVRNIWIVSSIIAVLGAVIVPIITCAVVPEMVGLQALLNAIQPCG